MNDQLELKGGILTKTNTYLSSLVNSWTQVMYFAAFSCVPDNNDAHAQVFLSDYNQRFQNDENLVFLPV